MVKYSIRVSEGRSLLTHQHVRQHGGDCSMLVYDDQAQDYDPAHYSLERVESTRAAIQAHKVRSTKPVIRCTSTSIVLRTTQSTGIGQMQQVPKYMVWYVGTYFGTYRDTLVLEHPWVRTYPTTATGVTDSSPLACRLQAAGCSNPATPPKHNPWTPFASGPPVA